MSNLEWLRTEYDKYMRREFEEAGTERQIDNHTIRYVMPAIDFGFVLYSDLTAQTADAAIQAQIAHFSELGIPFEWKYFDYDQPDDLPERLIKHGFVAEPAEAVMVLDIENVPARLTTPVTADVRQLTRETLTDADSVHMAVWGEQDKTLPSKRALHIWEQAPESLSLYVAYIDDQPVAYARLEIQPDNPFAYLWAGATLPQFRGRGLYTALVATRLQAAHARGCRYITVDAMPDTSMPIVQKLGFQRLALSIPFQWEHPTND